MIVIELRCDFISSNVGFESKFLLRLVRTSKRLLVSTSVFRWSIVEFPFIPWYFAAAFIHFIWRGVGVILSLSSATLLPPTWLWRHKLADPVWPPIQCGRLSKMATCHYRFPLRRRWRNPLVKVNVTIVPTLTSYVTSIEAAILPWTTV